MVTEPASPRISVGSTHVSARVVIFGRYSGSLTLEGDSLLLGVDLLSLGLVDGDLSLLVPSDVSGRLNDTSGFKGTDSDRRKQRCEQEVVSGRHYDDVVLVRTKVLEERGSSPAGSEDDKCWLGWVVVELISGVDLLLGD